MKINKTQRGVIFDIIDDLFWTLKANLLGRFFKGPKIYFEIINEANPMETLEGIYTFTQFMVKGPGHKVDQKKIEQISEIADNYLEAEKLRTKNKIIEGIGRSDDLDGLEEELTGQIKRATDYVNLVIGAETRSAQAMAESEGIVEVAASLGVEDPIICKRGVIDDRLSKQCRLLWHDQVNIFQPVVYKLSELSAGYNTDMKKPKPTVGLTHPNCRHIMSFVPPNFGFDDQGKLTFKGFGYNEWDSQHSGKKEKQ